MACNIVRAFIPACKDKIISFLAVPGQYPFSFLSAYTWSSKPSVAQDSGTSIFKAFSMSVRTSWDKGEDIVRTFEREKIDRKEATGRTSRISILVDRKGSRGVLNENTECAY